MPATKKALCIGVNYAGTDAELRGCVNDALQWVQVLTKSLNFKRRNVVAMIDEYPSGEMVDEHDEDYSRPTKENIMEALDWLVQDVTEGDVLLFAFSGHCTQVPDSSTSSEDDKLDEAICPIDWDEFEWGVVPYRLITDEILHQYFAKLPGGVLLTVVIDGCIAGAPFEVPLRIDFEHPDREIENLPVTQGEYREYRFNCDTWLQNQHVNALPRRLPAEPQRPLWSNFAKLFAKDTAPPLEEGLAVFCITASRGQQSALDVSLEGMPQGCMSYCLQRSLEQLNFRCTYLELCEAMGYIGASLRRDVMPYMDQFVQLSFAQNASPDECLFLEASSAFVAKDKARRRRGQKTRLRASR